MSKDGATVAMIMANTGVIPTNAWKHKSDLKDKNKNTVAMILLLNGIYDIPK